VVREVVRIGRALVWKRGRRNDGGSAAGEGGTKHVKLVARQRLLGPLGSGCTQLDEQMGPLGSGCTQLDEQMGPLGSGCTQLDEQMGPLGSMLGAWDHWAAFLGA